LKIFTKTINKLSVHFLTPLFLLIIVLFLVIQTYTVTIPNAIENEEYESKQELLGISKHTQITINNYLKENNDSYISQELELLHKYNKNIKFAGIFDENNQLKYITDSTYSEYAIFSINVLKDNQSAAKDIDFQNPYIYHDQMPQEIHAIVKVNLHSNSHGYLLIEYNFSKKITYIIKMITDLLIISLFAVVLVFFLFGLFVHIFFLKKIDLLNMSSKHLGEGAYGFQLQSNGLKEVKNIIDSFNNVSAKIADDVKKLKETQADLLYEKNTAQNYLDIVGVMILVLDKHNNVTMINKRGCEIIGYDLEDIIGKNWVENFLPERFRKAVVEVTDSIKENKLQDKIGYFKNPILTKNGKERLIEWRNCILHDQEGKVIGVLTSGEDVTESHSVQMRLKESESFYKNIFSSVHESIIIIENGTIVDCNDEAIKLFDTTKEMLVGVNIVDEIRLIQCKGIELDEILYRALAGNTVVSECSISINKLEFSKIANMSFSLLGKDDGRVICVAHDITKKLEQEKIFSLHARQAQMGEMISMIAHQWRQPLASVSAITTQMMFKEMLNERVDKESIENLNKIEEQVTYLSQTISDFRDFFRPDKPKEYIKLSKIVNNALNLLDNTIKNSAIEIKLVVHSDSELKTYKNELTQVFMTMIKNTIDAFKDKNIENKVLQFTLEQTKTHAQLKIEDNAGGIDTKIMKDIFLPYFSTKNREDGTGLGLYMSKTIVEDNCGGKLTVQNNGEKCVFTISLPLNEKGV